MAIAIGLGLLVLFFLLSIALGDEDTRQAKDPRDDLLVWMNVARH
jgi:hypothetical protein